jgi:hypothetical protein
MDSIQVCRRAWGKPRSRGVSKGTGPAALALPPQAGHPAPDAGAPSALPHAGQWVAMAALYPAGGFT